MYIDTNNLPEDFDLTDALKYARGGALVMDPTKSFNTIPNLMNQHYNQGGMFIDTTSNPSYEPYINPYSAIEERLNKLELENKFLKLKILGMEGKFSQDEIKNIRAMLMSNDEASITLANTIIETA